MNGKWSWLSKLKLLYRTLLRYLKAQKKQPNETWIFSAKHYKKRIWNWRICKKRWSTLTTRRMTPSAAFWNSPRCGKRTAF